MSDEAERGEVFVTRHAARRMRQRTVCAMGVELALRHGLRIEQNGATVYFLGRRHLPDEVPPVLASRLEGTTVVVGRDGSVITAYRTDELPRHLRERRRRRGHHHRPRGLHA